MKSIWRNHSVLFPAKLFLFALVAALFTGCAGNAPQRQQATQAGGGEQPSVSILPWQSGNLKIGYIRSDLISQEYPDYRDADLTLRNENRKWLQDVDEMEKNIQTKEQELEDLALILSEEQRATMVKEIQSARELLFKFRNDTWYDEDSDYVKRRKELMEPIDARVNDVIYIVAEEKGLDLVFDTVAGNIVYAKQGLDITTAVLEELKK